MERSPVLGFFRNRADYFGVYFEKSSKMEKVSSNPLRNRSLTANLKRMRVIPGDDPGFLVVPGGVPGQLEDLGGQILHDGGHIDRSAGPHAFGVIALPQETMNSAHGKLEAGSVRTRLGFTLKNKPKWTSKVSLLHRVSTDLDLSAFAASGHGDDGVSVGRE